MFLYSVVSSPVVFQTSKSILFCFSIEFDRDDELFATAGVSRRIKVFDFSSVRINFDFQLAFYYCLSSNGCHC